MLIGKITGTAVSTVKQDTLSSYRLLLVTPCDPSGNTLENPLLAVDLVGAGEGELVFISRGSSARAAAGNDGSAADAAVVGILDSLYFEGNQTYTKK